jgi:hypothetical protein
MKIRSLITQPAVRGFVLFAGCVQLLAACSKKDAGGAKPPSPLPLPPPAIKDTAPGFQFNILMDRVAYDSILADLASSATAQSFINTEVTAKADVAFNKAPNPLQSVKGNSSAANTDANNTLYLALQWFLFQKNTGTGKYLDKARKNLLAWAGVNAASDHTPDETSMLGFYKAYSLIRTVIDNASRSIIDNWFINKYNYFKGLAGWNRINNWETIRNLFLVDIAYMLNRADYITEAKASFLSHHDKEYRVDGASIDFLGRDAFAYHAYDMSFVSQVFRTIYIYEGRNAADEWVNHSSADWVIPVRTPSQQQAVSPEFFQPANYAGGHVSGGSLAKAMAFMKPYMLDTVNNKHLEFYYTEYNGDFSRSDYKNPFNPNSILYALNEVLAVMRDEVKGIFTALDPSYNRYKKGLMHYINSFGVSVKQPGPPKAVLAGDVGYLGWTKELEAGSYTLDGLQAIGIADKQLSGVIVPAGYRVTLYEGSNLDGNSIVLEKNAINLADLSFNDKMSSVKIEKK